MTRAEHTKLWKILKDYVILRDGMRCVVCGEVKKGLALSHFYPRGQYPRIEFEPLNVGLMCNYPCHLSWWHKNPIEAAEWYNRKIPLKQRNALKKLIAKYKEIPKLTFEQWKKIIEKDQKQRLRASQQKL